MHSLKAHCLWLLSHPIPLFFLSPPACAEMDDNNSVVHSIATHPSTPPAQRSILRRWLQHMHCCKSSPSLFCFHFFFFTFFLLFFLHFSFPPSECAMSGLPETKGMKLPVGCGSYEGSANALFLTDFLGSASSNEPIHSYPSKHQLMAIQRACLLPPDGAFQNGEVLQTSCGLSR